MTLILSCICNDGICVCADRRRKWIYPNRLPTYEDNLHKIFKFQNAPVLIFNHGINLINNRFWLDYCLSYEQSTRWCNLQFVDLANDFKSYIERDILIELKRNTLDHNVGFVVCGRCNGDGNYRIIEFYWSPAYEQKTHRGIVISGTGSKYLNDFFRLNPHVFKVHYWENISRQVAMPELKRLFDIAVTAKNINKGDEFSDAYDADSIS